MSEPGDDSSDDTPSLLRRLLVWGGSLLGGLAVLVLVAALLLPRLFPSEQLKGYVIPPLETATGRQVQIDTIGLRVLPSPAIHVSGFRLANAEGFGPAPAVEAEALDVNVALWPLFVGTIRPTAISLVDPVVRYEVAKDGTTNFDTVGGTADTTETEGSPLGGIPVSNFHVSGARLQYVNRSTGRSVHLEFNAQLNALPDGSAITSTGTVDVITTRAVLPEVGPDPLSLRDARITYDIRAALADGRIEFQDLRIETAPITLTAAGTLSGLNKQPTVDLTVKTGATNLAEIAAFVPAAAMEGFNPRGTLDLKATVSGPLSDSVGTGSSLTVTATGQLTDAGIDYRGRALLRDLNADLALSLDTVSVQSIRGTLLGASLAGHVTVLDVMAEPRLDLRLETGAMDLSDLTAVVPTKQIEGHNPQGALRLRAAVKGPLPDDLGSVEAMTIDGTGQLTDFGMDYGGKALLRDLEANLSFSNTSVSVQSIDGTLLGRPLTGAITVKNPLGTRRVEGRLAGTADVAELVALTSDQSAKDASVQGVADYDVHFAGPMDNLEAIRPEGQVRLADVRYPYDSFRHPIEIPRMTVQLTETGLSTDQFTLRSGKQTAALRTTVRNLFPLSKGLADTDPALSASFTLTADRLDLVELYPKADTSAPSYSRLFAAYLSGSEVNGRSPATLAEKLYGGLELPAYTVDGRVEIGTLLNPPQRYDGLAFDVRMEDRRLTVRNLSASTYGGQLGGSLTFDQRAPDTATDSTPEGESVLLASTAHRPVPTAHEPVFPASALTYDFQLQGANTGAVLTDWTSLGSLVTGTLTLDVKGDTPLTEGLLPSTTALTAIGQSAVVDGGLSLNAGPAKALVEALGLPSSAMKNFGRLGGPFRIEDGKVQMDTWTLRGGHVQGDVKGTLGLGGSVDLEVTLELPLSMLQNSQIPSLVEGSDGRIGDLLKRLVGSESGDETVPVTVKIGGTMRDPTVQLLNRDAIASRIRSLAAEAGLELLQNLFGGEGG